MKYKFLANTHIYTDNYIWYPLYHQIRNTKGNDNYTQDYYKIIQGHLVIKGYFTQDQFTLCHATQSNVHIK